MWEKIVYASQNVNDTVVEFWEWISNFSPKFTGHVITYSCQEEKIRASKMSSSLIEIFPLMFKSSYFVYHFTRWSTGGGREELLNHRLQFSRYLGTGMIIFTRMNVLYVKCIYLCAVTKSSTNIQLTGYSQ